MSLVHSYDMDAAVLALFREHGVHGEVREATFSPDEVVFAVSPTDASTMRERELTHALQMLLGRKVWITTAPAS